MKVTQPTSHNLVYHLLRFTPLGAAPLILQLTGLPQDTAIRATELIVAALVILFLWNLTEGTLMLWYRANLEKSDKTRGYGIVAALLSLVTLFVLPLYRSKCSQGAFIVLLTTLALRGVARSAWQQDKPHVAIPTIWASHSLLAALSFLTVQDSLQWQAVVVSLSVGAALTTCEVAWNRSCSLEISQMRWLLPTLRVLFFFGPISLATLALMGQLNKLYGVVLVALVWSQRASRAITAARSLSPLSLLGAAGFYATFIGIIAGCTYYLR
jgi:hypothetical protein